MLPTGHKIFSQCKSFSIFLLICNGVNFVHLLSSILRFFLSFYLLKMQFYLCQVLSSILISISINLVNAQKQDNVLYKTCSTPFQCGNLKNISYPFWGSDRPDYCGYPGFSVKCINQTLFIRTGQLDYRILQIDTNSQSLTVSRPDYISTICPSLLFNTTFDQNLFAYASDLQNITLYYGCPPPVQSSANFSIPANGFSCGTNKTILDGYFLTGSLNSSSLNISIASCDDSVIVPALKSANRFVESSPSQSSLMEALNQGFGLQWIANNTLCETCTSSGGFCGHNATISSFSCYCPDKNYPFGCEAGIDLSKFALSAVIPILVSLAAVCSCVVCCCCCCFTKRGRFWIKWMFFGWKKTKEDKKIEAFMMNYQSLLANRYSYWGLKKITNSFSSMLGEGGFGGVYKGKLADGRLVAVKLLNKSAGDGEDFINEVASISRTSHINIVNLLGFCFERSKRALVYEYMPNGSLDNHINDRGDCHLEWEKLYEIAVGVARGLEYLHRGCSTRIVHFDIKPHNILLDENFCPKISDFGLAKLCKGKETIMSTLGGARGTAGYIAPEVFMRSCGGVSYKSDVYSYGMMVLEMFGGKNNIDAATATSNRSEVYFSDWIYNHLQPGEILRIHGNLTGEEEETVRRMIIVGLWCIQTNPLDRPSMTKVVEMLEGTSVESLHIPPKPFLYSNTSNAQCSFDSMTASSLSVYGWSGKEEEKSFVAAA